MLLSFKSSTAINGGLVTLHSHASILITLLYLNLFRAIFLSQNSHVILHLPTLSVGKSERCGLWVIDPAVSKSLCSLKHIETEVCCDCQCGT